MRFLVTGATGFIGQQLVQHLLDTGRDVSLLLREEYSLGKPLPPTLAGRRQQFQTLYADLRSYPLVRRAIHESQPDIIFHLAAAGVTDPFLSVETALRHNLHGTLHLLRACFEGNPSPAKQLISGRTPGENSAMNVYAASKAAAWNFCQLYARTQQWPIVGAMIFQAYGPGQPSRTLIPSAIAAAQQGHNFPMTSGRQKRDWIYIQDVIAGLLAIAPAKLAPGQTVELGTGRATTTAEVVQTIYDLSGRGGQPLLGALSDRPGEELQQIANSHQSLNQLGWQAQISLQQGLEKLIQQPQ